MSEETRAPRNHSSCRDCGRRLFPAAGADRPRYAVPHSGRGLCHACYQRHRNHGTLDRFPASNRPAMGRAEVLRQYDELKRAGVSTAEAARRIGIERTALYGHLRRDRRRPARLSEAELARFRRMLGVSP